MKIKISMVTLVTLLAVTAGFAEPRIWTDTKGRAVEAEFILQTGDKALLRKTDGTEVKIPLDSLCESDRLYIVKHAPPPLEIDVDMDIDRSNTGNGRRIQIQTETVAAEVTVRKLDTSHYDAPFRSEIYLIGERDRKDDYVIMDQAKSEFKFEGGRRGEHTYTSGRVSRSQFEARAEAGTEYKGYLAVVYDQYGTLLEVKSNKKEFEQAAAAILQTRGGDIVDKNFELLAKAEEKEPKKLRRF